MRINISILLIIALVDCYDRGFESPGDAGYYRAIESISETDADTKAINAESGCHIYKTSRLDCNIEQEVCIQDGSQRISTTKINCPDDIPYFPWKDLPDPPR